MGIWMELAILGIIIIISFKILFFLAEKKAEQEIRKISEKK